MLQAVASFGRNDLKSIRRDTLMIGVALGPFLYAFAMWLVPPLTRFLERQYAFDLTPYHMLIVSMFVVVGPVAVLGALCGLMLLEDKDQHTLAALRVAPIPPLTYPLYRTLVIVGVTAVSVVVALAVTRLVPAEVLVKSIPVAIVSGMGAAVVGLLMPVVAGNKVEGLAIMRAVGTLLFGLPVIPWFIDSPAHLLFGVLPTYWPAKAFWLAAEGANFWPYIAGGLAYNSLLAVLLLHRLHRREV
ncbi:MAG: ABC transporter permease [Pseudonocardiaceae bacterium]